MDEGHAGLIKWKHLYKIGSIGIIFLSMWKNYQWRHLSLEFLVSESFNHRFNFCGRYSDFLSHVVFGIWHTCQKSFDWIREGLFQSSLHPVPWVYACLHAYTTLFWLLLVCSKLWNQEVRPPVFFFFFFRTILAIRGPLRFHMNFGMGFSVSTEKKKMPLRFWQGLY